MCCMQEVIVGKCRVLCTAEDDYNKLPSRQQLQVADFFFNKAFDCDAMEITGLDNLCEDIGGIHLEPISTRFCICQVPLLLSNN